MFDDNTLHDRADGDGAILTLFHEWQTAWTAPNASDEEDNETLEAANELWRRLCDLPASGPIGIAIKAYLVARTEYANETPLGLRAFNASDYGAGDNLFLNARAARGLLADAARFVPELAPLMAEIVAAPDKLPPPLASDEELIAAEGEIASLPARRVELVAHGHDAARRGRRHAGRNRGPTMTAISQNPSIGELAQKRADLWKECAAAYNADDEDSFDLLVSKTRAETRTLEEQIAQMTATTRDDLLAMVNLLGDEHFSHHSDYGKRVIAAIRRSVRALGASAEAQP